MKSILLGATTMRFPRLDVRSMVTAVLLICSPIAAMAAAEEGMATSATPQKLDNATCQTCHDGHDGRLETATSDGGLRPLYVVKEDAYASSVHSKMQCVACHQEITDSVAPHQIAAKAPKVDCAQCHVDLWETAQKNGQAQEKIRMGIVAESVAAYRKSFHARANKDDPGKVNATCNDCHNVHSFNVPVRGTDERKEWHLSVPLVCGKCHEDELADWTASVHGQEVTQNHNLNSAVCSDCHSVHAIGNPQKSAAQLQITANCGGCHADQKKTYVQSYHGQVNTLGYTHTAACFDCHGSHSIQPASDPRSMLHASNRLETCQTCHKGATAGYATFQPHGSSHDFIRYPVIWMVSKFMLLLLGGIFVFFWSHTALWFYREHKERAARTPVTLVKTAGLADDKNKNKYYRRFSLVWRAAHLIFALCVMTLALTGMAVLYADSAWAPIVVKWLGGPKDAAVIHRACAALLGVVFGLHLIFLLGRIARNWRAFDWFGPNSLLPRWQDLWDILAMVKWFLGMGPKPVFDRWTYWQKFDYWAPFAALMVIGTTGLMLAFPATTASYLPGWAFNIATILHGEEALLAILFVFTVHFFNNHFRPDKFPLDVVMFTGSVSLDEFKYTHRVEYNRLVASGELEQHLVDAPSQPMTRGSKVLGFTLIAIGLILLVLVLIGFYGHLIG
jgi:cytochrome b subunit of formate dehydrogenase